VSLPSILRKNRRAGGAPLSGGDVLSVKVGRLHWHGAISLVDVCGVDRCDDRLCIDVRSRHGHVAVLVPRRAVQLAASVAETDHLRARMDHWLRANDSIPDCGVSSSHGLVSNSIGGVWDGLVGDSRADR